MLWRPWLLVLRLADSATGMTPRYRPEGDGLRILRPCPLLDLAATPDKLDDGK